MLRRNLFLVWLGIVLLSGMFLLGQQPWPPEQECIDKDVDGYGNPAAPWCTFSQLDCDDSNPDVNPGTTEGPYGDPTCSDELDNDCDDDTDVDDSGCCECMDGDSDGYGDPGCENCTYPATDCDDSNPDVNPGASEGPGGDPTCSDTLDNDCDGDADSADRECVNGIILGQELNVSDQGYTVLRVWGSHYEMGYAHASLLADYIVDGVAQFKAVVGPNYSTLRDLVVVAVWQPPEIEDEIEGMVDSLSVTHPLDGIDDLDLKVMNTNGDWSWACRSHTCWGRYVQEPIKTLATRRLDIVTPVPMGNHHVLCAWDPQNGSPRWVTLGWSGYVSVVTGVNEFGTLVSLNDYNSNGADLSAGRMSRMVAARHALTFPVGDDLSTHREDAFAALQGYEIMTGGFVTYYTPEGHGGVMTADPYEAGPDFYDLRVPQAVWHHGEAMITTNAWTDGTTTPADEDFFADVYYGDRVAQDPREPLGLAGDRRRPRVSLVSHAQRGLPWSGRHDPLGRWEAGRCGSDPAPRVGVGLTLRLALAARILYEALGALNRTSWRRTGTRQGTSKRELGHGAPPSS